MALLHARLANLIICGFVPRRKDCPGSTPRTTDFKSWLSRGAGNLCDAQRVDRVRPARTFPRNCKNFFRPAGRHRFASIPGLIASFGRRIASNNSVQALKSSLVRSGPLLERSGIREPQCLQCGRCPLLLQRRSSTDCCAKSQLCHFRTHAVPQNALTRSPHR
jgi:hypothetical protein